MLSFYEKQILPRIIFIPFLLTRLMVEALNLLTFYKFFRSTKKSTKLCIESGLRGWDILEYKELYQSATEYLNSSTVLKVKIDKEKSYLSQVFSAISLHKPTHYLYDARTGSDNWFKGLFESFTLSLYFQINGIVPICTLPNTPVRKWRAQTSMVSAKRGIVTSLMAPIDISYMFPHRRIIGPQPMAFSKKSLKKIIEQKKSVSKKQFISFIGSVYEPRKSILEKINEGLKNYELQIEMRGNQLGEKKSSDEDYWKQIIESKIVITTANQIDNSSTDHSWLPHLIYRYIEVTFAGSALLAQAVPGIQRYFDQDVDYISYKTTEEAIEKIIYYEKNPRELSIIAENGFIKAKSIIQSQIFWINIDNGLGKNSLL